MILFVGTGPYVAGTSCKKGFKGAERLCHDTCSSAQCNPASTPSWGTLALRVQVQGFQTCHSGGRW